MPNGMIANGNGREMTGDVTRPQQSMAVTESSRTLAEIQGALTVAAARPRNVNEAIDRIMTTCQRARMAETATYQYSKGGQSIAGPSIRLMEAIANNWGNITFGFRELSQSHGESTVEAFAWDLETNTKRTVTFVVPHRMKSGNSYKQLVDPREIYEYVANQSQRRVRSCLENVIPRDIVEDAVDECSRTLVANVEVTPESIKKLVAYFQAEYGVSKAQLEQRLQRRIESMTPANMIAMRRIVTSLKDGVAEVSDFFKPVKDDPQDGETKTSGKGTEGAKDKLKKNASTGNDPERPASNQTEKKSKQETPKAKADPPQPAAADPVALSETGKSFLAEIDKAKTVSMLQEFSDTIADSKDINDEERQHLFDEINWRIEALQE